MDGSPRPMSALPDEPEMDDEAVRDSDDGGERSSSLFSEIGSLIEDGKTYAEAELAFQKTRASYVVSHAKWAAIFGGIAAVLVVMAIFAMVFGLILSLAPILTPIGATVAVTLAMLIVAALLATVAKLQLRKAKSAFGTEEERP